MSNNKYKILVVEDEANIRSFVETILETNSYQVISTCTCKQAQFLFACHNPDLIILDLGLPDLDGTEFIKNLRTHSTAPIIVLSARTTESDKITALDLGANDYITKPFSPGELQARIRVALRNKRHCTPMGAVPGGCFKCGSLRIDYDSRLVTIDGRDVNLTQTEYNIVTLLSEHAGKVLTYTTIIREIWGLTGPGAVKKLQVNMANIRKKLGVKPGEQALIQNELGVGYRMDAEGPAS